MKKVAVNYARGRTIWSDTFERSMREAHRVRMLCIANRSSSSDVCLKGIDEFSCRVVSAELSRLKECFEGLVDLQVGADFIIVVCDGIHTS
jgi:hypothetical protein